MSAYSFDIDSLNASSFGIGDNATVGLDDTATGFSASSTMDPYVIAGSDLPLTSGLDGLEGTQGAGFLFASSQPGASVLTAGSTGPSVITLGPQTIDNSAIPVSETASYDLWNSPSPAGSLALSATSDTTNDPTSAYLGSPYPGASPLSSSLSAAMSSLSKLGVGIAQIVGGATALVAPKPNVTYVTGTAAQAPTTPVSGVSTTLLLIIVGMVVLLLVKGD